MLFKRSMKKDRTTSKQRRLFLLSGPFLFYYKKEKDATPCGVIPLEYYVIRKKLNKKRKFSMMLTLASDAFKNMTGSYKLQADTLESMECWFEKIKKKVCPHPLFHELEPRRGIQKGKRIQKLRRWRRRRRERERDRPR